MFASRLPTSATTKKTKVTFKSKLPVYVNVEYFYMYSSKIMFGPR